MLSLALAILALSPTMAGPPVASVASSAPPPIFVAVASNPAGECDGAAIVSTVSVTHTNATTTRYCQKSNGLLVAMTANQPRVTNNGILVEGSRTNLILRTDALDNAAWTATNVTVSANSGPDPTNVGTTADSVGTDVAGGFLVNTTAIVPSQATGTASVWFRDSGIVESPTVIIRDSSAGADRATCNFTTPGDANWYRYSCNVAGMTGASNHLMRIYPGGVAGDNNDTLWVWNPQFEVSLANFRTSTVPTAGSSVTRANDVYSWSNPTDISAKGCLRATVTFGQSAQFGGSVLANGTEVMMGTTSATAVRINDGTNTVTATVADLTGRTVDILTKWSGSTMTVVADGVTASGTFDGAFSATSTMRIGATAAGSGYCSCWVDNIKVGANPESCN